MTADDSDEALGARLDSALRTDLEAEQVNVPGLLQGSRHRARSIRNQRIAGATAAVVLIVAVPLGYEVINPGADARSSSAVLLPSGSRAPVASSSGATDRPDPNPTAVPSAVPPSGAISSTGPVAAVVPVPIPESFVAFGPGDLPPDLVLQGTAGNRGEVLVAGQSCGPLSSDQPRQLRQQTGREWVWHPEVGSATEDAQVTVTVTGWAVADAPAAFARGVAGTGFCRWDEPQQVRTPADLPGAERWASTSSSGGYFYARTLVRVGNGIVGVEVQNPDGVDPAVALADRLARAQALRMQPG
jgi:hypothetical protein